MRRCENGFSVMAIPIHGATCQRRVPDMRRMSKIGYDMEEILIRARPILDTRGSETEIILVAQVPIHPDTDPMFDQESLKKSGELALIYRDLYHSHGCLYLDGGSATRDVGEDGIHLSFKGHRALGEAIAVIIKEHEQCLLTKLV